MKSLGTTTKKIIRSRDVVFFENQTIEDLDQAKKPKPINKEQVDLGPISPNTMGHNEHKEVVQEEQVDTIDRNDESTVDDVEEILQLRMMALFNNKNKLL